jgi:peptidyl-prolyl cis-trans isomerase B (cyclophilin B)
VFDLMAKLKLSSLKSGLVCFVLMVIPLFCVTAWAGLTKSQVSQLYVSVFNRASEGGGNAYWQSQPEMTTAADVMLETDAAKSYFGANLNTNQAFIEHIYLNTLNKNITDDPNGIAHWVGELNYGKSRGQVVAALVGVIKDYAPEGPFYNPGDAATIAAYNQFTNRVTVSDYMADTVLKAPDDWATSTKFDATGLNVTDDAATIVAARSVIQAWAVASTVQFEQLREPKTGDILATLTTNHGAIEILLFPEVAPKAVENFVTHAKEGYYDGHLFFRVMDNFMIQGGDPTATGTGGQSIWGTAFEDEFGMLFPYRGALCMANSGPNTNASQFFIVQLGAVVDGVAQSMTNGGFPVEMVDAYERLGGTHWLYGVHTVFGQVQTGMDVVDAIAKVAVVGTKPVEDVIIENIVTTTAK